jgi:hypothetical protein
MFRHGNARRAVLLLMVLAVAFLWTADQGIRAAANERAEVSATPAPPPPSTTAKAADKAAAATTVKDPPPATTATTAAEPAPAAPAAPQKPPTNRVTEKRLQNQKIQEAAKAARARGLKPGVAGLAGTPLGAPVAAGMPAPSFDPGGIPHYFGPYGNWAFSPIPAGTLNTALTVTAGGDKYSNSPVVTVTDAYDATKAPVTATSVSVRGGAITAITIPAGLTGYSAPVVTITDTKGSGAAAYATFDPDLAGGLPKFVDKLPALALPGGFPLVSGGPDPKNALGQYIPVGLPESCTFSGQVADCYSIALVEYSEKLSSALALPATKLRGYVQLETPGVVAVQSSVGLTS